MPSQSAVDNWKPALAQGRGGHKCVYHGPSGALRFKPGCQDNWLTPSCSPFSKLSSNASVVVVSDATSFSCYCTSPLKASMQGALYIRRYRATVSRFGDDHASLIGILFATEGLHILRTLTILGHYQIDVGAGGARVVRWGRASSLASRERDLRL